MNETYVTLQGWVGADVQHRTPKGTSVATLRVGVTPRLRNKVSGAWQDGETTWYTVTAWRALADNVADSVRKGDAVIVHGRLRTETWHPEGGQASTTLHVEASLVGHDLTRGQSAFVKAQRPEKADEDLQNELHEMIRESHEEVAAVGSWGVLEDPAPAEPEGEAESALV